MNSDNKIKVSVLIPICNVEKYLPQCLESVMSQTMEELQIICINDGSKDNSLGIIQQYAEKDPRILVIDKPNSGYGDSMNVGLGAVTGEYVGIVESDDFIDKSMFKELYELSDSGKVDVIKSNFYNYYDDGKGASSFDIDGDRLNIPDSEKPFTLQENGQFSWGHPSVWSAIYRTAFLKEHNIHFIAAKGGGWVDNPFYYETLCAAKSIMWTSKAYYYYRKTNPTSSSNLQRDPSIPFVRMQDNFDMLERYNIIDVDTLKCAYARALMYYNGALKDFDYDAQAREINDYAAEMMKRIDPDIFLSNFNARDKFTYYDALSPIKNRQLDYPRILIYNWTPYNNPWNAGGGVTVYCRNLIREIAQENPEINIYFLSSGFAYDASTTDIYTRKLATESPNIHQYEIINSPVPADQSNVLINPSVALENEELKKAFKSFVERYGPFDVIHFNNIEGISLDIFDLKESFPETKFVFSIHNYVPMCLHGFYYMRHQHCNCNPNHTAEDCMKCSRVNIRKNIADATYERGLFGNDPSKCLPKEKWVQHLGFERLDDDIDEKHILDFSKTSIEKINKNCDEILAVSKRVLDIAAQNGFVSQKMHVSYIGTQVAKHQLGHSAYPPREGLKIVFLGNDVTYEEKGYPFLLNALEKLDKKYASQIDLVLTMRQRNNELITSRLSAFRNIKIYNGYTHADLPKIFDGRSLSIVPVLWEDNLPQIAIESVAYGIPVLSSTAGGASELTDSALFRFKAGDENDLLEKIVHFLENPKDLQEYWEYHHGLVTMAQHWREIKRIYGLKEITENITFTMDEYRSLLRKDYCSNQAVNASFLRKPQINNPQVNIVEERNKRLQRIKPTVLRKVIAGGILIKEKGIRYTIDYINGKQ